MFGNRGYGWKVGAATAVVALLGVWAAVKGRDVNPELWRAVAQPERWDGRFLWVPAATIESVETSAYTIVQRGARVRVRGPAPAAAGERVTVRGVFRAAGRTIDPVEDRALPVSRRWIVEAVSVAVLIVVAFNFLRHFSVRKEVLRVERTG